MENKAYSVSSGSDKMRMKSSLPTNLWSKLRGECLSTLSVKWVAILFQANLSSISVCQLEFFPRKATLKDSFIALEWQISCSKKHPPFQIWRSCSWQGYLQFPHHSYIWINKNVSILFWGKQRKYGSMGVQHTQNKFLITHRLLPSISWVVGSKYTEL